MSKKKRKHHYLPQFYVGGFANPEGKVFVLHKEKNTIEEQGKNGTFHIPYFYSVDFSKYKKRTPERVQKVKNLLGLGEIDTSRVKEYPDMVEDLLGESENYAAVIIQKLINGKKISNNERLELSTFMAIMFTRTPTFRENMNQFHVHMTDLHIKNIFASKENAEEIYKKMKEDGYDKEVDIEALVKTTQEGRYKIEIPREMSVQDMLMIIPMIDQILCQKSWFLLRTSSGFITTDIPVFLDHPNLYNQGAYGVGFETPGVKAVFTLSKELLLIMKSTKLGASLQEEIIEDRNVREINKLIALHSRKYIISHNKEVLKDFIKR